ncbi:molybdopterin-dependent oxidoreductase [Nocardioides sp. YIM 152588]|uniref:molybdopterin-dependent oxidoreductase n=1 Tax=Nocardioides sp. YIM 152588 TaxID=3158259 RepID=UPI0032E4A751
MRTSRRWWSLAGIVVGALGLAASYLAAALLHVRESPVVAVAEGVTALTPGFIAEWAIQNLGTSDKSALVIGILVILGLLFALLGVLGRRQWWWASLGFVVLAVVGGVAVAAKPGTTGTDLVPVFVGLFVWLGAFALCAQALRRWEVVEESDDLGHDPAHTRRGFFVLVGVLAAGTAVVGGLGRIASGAREKVEHSRRLLRLEKVTEPKPPAAARVDVPGVPPWQTPAEDFYLIDTAFIKPTLEPVEWELRIHGMVEREITLSYDDLVSREITEDWITLNCVSNEVGGNLIGNAWWSGVRLAGIIAEAGPKEGADAVLQTSVDGWTCGTPLAALTDDRNAMLAVAMNGEPLPVEHGFPVRTIVPGLYGYVSACKWVVDMEVTRFEDFDAYWTQKGWSEMGPVKLSSRIDVPTQGSGVDAGTVVVAGTAWHQNTGIETVEVSLDGGAWTPATLAEVPSMDTWVQWRAEVDVDAGDHSVRVRATNRDGEVQTGVETGVLPDGATGWHTVGFSAS